MNAVQRAQGHSLPGVEKFEGVFSLLLTPFQETGEIDWPAYDAYVDWQVSHEPHGLFAVCGSGEMLYLTLAERLALAKRAVARAGDLPVVATANLEADRRTHDDEIIQMAETGVAGIVLIPPQGLEGAARHDYLAGLATGAPCPVLLYEWPHVNPCEIPAASYQRLVREQGVYGIKDTTCTVAGIQAKLRAAPESVVYQANTPFLLQALEMGARGILATISAAAADRVLALWHAVQRDERGAVAIHEQLVFLDTVQRLGYPASAKYLASLRDVPLTTHCRAGSQLRPEGAKAMATWWQAVQRSEEP